MKRAFLFFGLLAISGLVWGYFKYIHVPSKPAPIYAGQLKEHTLIFDGRERQYSVYVPDVLDHHPPIVFVFHGSGSSRHSMRQATGYGFERLGAEQGFLTVYPQGYEDHWNDCRASASYSANQENVDDVAFFRAMIERLSQDYSADVSHVYVTGISNGGHMTLRLAWEAPDLVAAVAPVAANEPQADNFDCNKRDVPVSIALFNGTEDPINPYEGGLVEVMGDASRGHVLSSDATIGYWRNVAGYEGDGNLTPLQNIRESDGSSVEKIVWRKPGGPDVRLYRIVGGGHTFPNQYNILPPFLGPTNQDIDGADEMWAFFTDIE